MEEAKTRLWLGENGIVKIKIEKDLNEKVIERILAEYGEIAKKLPGKPNVSVDITSSFPMPSFIFRKKIVEIIKNAINNPGFNKIAEWGAPNKVVKTITMFIVGSINLKNFKYFDDEKEALKWIKEK